MIFVRVIREGNGCLRSMHAGGHASDGVGLFGKNVVCSAVSSLLRAFAGAVARRDGVEARGRSSGPGEMDVLIDSVSGDEVDWMEGATSVLVEGLSRLVAEVPNELDVEIQEIGNGT